MGMEHFRDPVFISYRPLPSPLLPFASSPPSPYPSFFHYIPFPLSLQLSYLLSVFLEQVQKLILLFS